MAEKGVSVKKNKNMELKEDGMSCNLNQNVKDKKHRQGLHISNTYVIIYIVCSYDR